MKITSAIIAEITEYAETIERGIALAVETNKPAIESYFRAELATARAFLAAHTPEPPAAPKVKCAFHGEIRRFFAIAREHGLDTKESNAAMRRAFENFFCRPIESRSELNGRDWAAAADAVKSNRLAW